jgi:hypothetical protein
LPEVISPKVPNWSPDSYTKAFSNLDSNSPRNSTSEVLTRYGPLLQMLFAMSQYGKLVVGFGPLRQICSSAMGNCGGIDYALWATTRYEVVQ